MKFRYPWTRLPKALIAAGATAALLFTAGAPHLRGHAQTGAAGPSEQPAEGERYASGRALYLDYHCGSCHALRAAGSAGFFGPGQDALGIVAQARIADPGYTGSATTAAEYIRESIVDPGAYIVPGYAFTRHHMPTYDMSAEELDALVFFLVEQDGGGP